MAYLATDLKSFFCKLTVLSSLCCGGFLFSSNFDLLKYVIVLCSLITIITSYKNLKNDTIWCEFVRYISPWIPLLIGISLLIIVHGIHGYSIYVNAFLISLLLFFSLSFVRLKRENIVLALTANLLVISLLILFHYCLWGIVDSGFYGINKNKLIPGVALLSSLCITEFTINHRNYGSRNRLFIVVSTLLSLFAIVLAEVRTALLAFFAIVPILIFYRRSGRRKVCVLFGLLLIAFISGFIISGRMQEGILDLTRYGAGNSNSSWGIRLELWKLSLNAFAEHPFFGWGSQPFNLIVASGFHFPVKSFHPQHFHSDYFNMLVGGGLVGIGSWLLSIGLLFKTAFCDPIRISVLFASLAMGLSERFWFSNQSSLFLLITIWLLLSLSFRKE